MLFHITLGNRGGEISSSHGKRVGHHHMEGREQQALENIAASQNLDNSRSEPWLELKSIIASAEQGWGTCIQHKVVPRPWEWKKGIWDMPLEF